VRAFVAEVDDSGVREAGSTQVRQSVDTARHALDDLDALRRAADDRTVKPDGPPPPSPASPPPSPTHSTR